MPRINVQEVNKDFPYEKDIISMTTTNQLNDMHTELSKDIHNLGELLDTNFAIVNTRVDKVDNESNARYHDIIERLYNVRAELSKTRTFLIMGNIICLGLIIFLLFRG